MDLLGKVALITGGAQGIGEACAYELLKRQCDVLIADINVRAIVANCEGNARPVPRA